MTSKNTTARLHWGCRPFQFSIKEQLCTCMYVFILWVISICSFGKLVAEPSHDSIQGRSI